MDISCYEQGFMNSRDIKTQEQRSAFYQDVARLLMYRPHPTYGQTIEFDGGTTYSVSGFPSPEAALWAAFRGIAITYKLRGEDWRKAKRAARSAFSKEQIARLDGIALGKIS